MGKIIHFTNIEKEKIKKFYLEDGMAVNKIGDLFKVSTDPIIRILKEQNIFMNPQEKRCYLVKIGKINSSKYFEFSENKKQKVKQLYKSGMSPIDIAKQFGHDRDVIVLFLKNNNLYTPNIERRKYLYKIGKVKCARKIHLTENQKSKIKSMYIDDIMSCEEIGKIMFLSDMFIEKFLRKEKVLYDKYQRRKDRCNAGKITPIEKINFTDKQVENMITLFTKERKNSYEIGNLYNCSQCTILKILRKNNIYTSQKRIFNAKEKKQIINLYQNQGKNINKLSKQFKTSNDTMTELLKNLKVYCNNSERRKFLFKSGKLKAWNKNLTKEDPRVVKNTSSEKSIACRFKKGQSPKIKGSTFVKTYGGKEADRIVKQILATKKKNGTEPKLEKNPRWLDGKSFEPYSPEFNKALKLKIKERDSFTCQECKRTELDLISENIHNRTLRIHHIDYNKKNSSPINLISLCQWCHMKTNSNRKHWEEYFKMKIFMKEFFNPKNILAFNENKQLVGVQRCN